MDPDLGNQARNEDVAAKPSLVQRGRVSHYSARNPGQTGGRFRKIADGLIYLYFLRCSILSAAALIGLPWICARFKAFLGGMFVLEDPIAIAFVSCLGFILAAVTMLTSRLTLFYGESRFGVRPPRVVSPRMKLWQFFCWMGLNLPLILYVGWELPPLSRGRLVVFVASGAGLIVALMLLFLAAILQHLAFPSARPAETLVDFLFPQNDFLRIVLQKDLRTALLQTVIRKIAQFVGPGVFAGYITESIDDKGDRHYEMNSGHCLALSLVAVAAFFYFAGYLLLDPRSSNFTQNIPALAYVLILFIALALLLPGISFFFDRYRLPVVAVAILWVMGVYWIFDSDHYYLLRPVDASQAQTLVSESASLQRWESQKVPERPIVIVAASGGGIQASAWTTKVLAGLEQDCGDKFHNSLVLVSGVSGGSVGAMYFLNEYGNPRESRVGDNSLSQAVSLSKRSSLNNAAWGLVFPDFLRTIAPYLVKEKLQDRAWSIEQAWTKDWTGKGRTLADWRTDLANGVKPAVVMNATFEESGQRYLLTNFDGNTSSSVGYLSSVYKQARSGRHFTVDVVTAARLSATFPYVTPMAQPMLASGRRVVPGFHVADGGYYDNFGVFSALEWLDHVRGDFRKMNGSNVLLIQIEAFTREEPGQPKGRWGYVEQAGAPISALMTVRTAAQIGRNEAEIEHFKESWKQEIPNSSFDPIVFSFKSADSTSQTPLSWHLTSAQQKDIDASWDLNVNASRTAVKKILGCGLPEH